MDQDPSPKSKKLSYKDSGVDIEIADQTVEWMKEQITHNEDAPHSKNVVSGIGGFSALFAPDLASYKEPLLVSSTDGIGTKLLMGLQSGIVKGLAQDLVAMCANDLVCVGAEPLFFLDYFASSKLDPEFLKIFFKELKAACTHSNMALIGGETAELPGLYEKGHFDAAGFSVGVVDKAKMWSPEKVKDKDKLLLVGSSGFHSNGFSLLRKIFGEDGGEFKKELMEPTVLYWPLVKKIKNISGVKACAHITGGGLDNLLRVLPKGSRASIEKWQWSKLLNETQKRSGLSTDEMLKTFNCGVGLILVVSEEDSKEVAQCIKEDFNLVSTGVVELSNDDSESEWFVG